MCSKLELPISQFHCKHLNPIIDHSGKVNIQIPIDSLFVKSENHQMNQLFGEYSKWLDKYRGISSQIWWKLNMNLDFQMLHIWSNFWSHKVWFDLIWCFQYAWIWIALQKDEADMLPDNMWYPCLYYHQCQPSSSSSSWE